MKRLLRKVTIMSGLACGLFLISCQDESQVTAIQAAADAQKISQAPPAMTAALRLTKYDNDTLIYNSDGKIKQVLKTVENTKYRTDYKYANNSIVAIVYKNGISYLKKEWQLVNGRAVKFIHKDFSTGGLSGVSTSTVDYFYNDKNQLIKLISYGDAKTTITLSYDNMGNVFKFLYVRNTPGGDEFLDLVKYDYTEYVGGPTQPDKGSTIDLHVFSNKTLGWMGDPYLPIFGKFGKNLLKKITPTNYLSPAKYTYNLDANGYVKEKKTLTEKGEFIFGEQLKYAAPVKDRPEYFTKSK